MIGQLPNTVSIMRLISAPVLISLAWFGYDSAFLIILVCAVTSDAVDGYIARKFSMTSELGAKLDSWADVAIYFTIVYSAYLLWPEILFAELTFFIIFICCVVIPPLTGFLKFGELTSYHTWLVKFGAATAHLSTWILFLGYTAWPFRTAAILTTIAALEQIAITIVLDKPVTDLRSFWHARRLTN